MQKDIILIRHGRSTMNVAVAALRKGDKEPLKAFVQQHTYTSCPLVPEGKNEIKSAAKMLLDEGLHPAFFHCSHMVRGAQSASILTDEMDLPRTPVTSPLLVERYYGVYDKDMSKMFDRNAHGLFDFDPPDGESSVAIYTRAHMIVEWLRAHPAGVIGIVGHGEMMSWIRAVFEGWSKLTHPDLVLSDISPKNAEIWHFRIGDIDTSWRSGLNGNWTDWCTFERLHDVELHNSLLRL